MNGDVEGSGSAPSYADLARGCLREERSQLTLEATTAGALPARMPDQDTHLSIGFELTSLAGSSLFVTAEATDAGWSAYLTRGQGRQALAAPTVRGSEVRISLPASELGSARRLTWRTESSWLRTTTLSTAYAFDDAPNGGAASFDRR